MYYEAKTALETIKQKVNSLKYSNPASLHNFNKERFNLVDLANRY